MLIRYYGHVGAPSGYGQAANETCMAILAAGLGLEIATDAKEIHRRYLPLASHVRDQDNMSPPDVVIVHTLPIDCGRVIEVAKIRELYPKALRVAYTTWEGASPVSPVVAKALMGFQAVWAPSQVTAEAFRAWYAPGSAGRDLIATVPHAYDDDVAIAHVAPDTFMYVFYYIGAWNIRKNVDGLIRAYVRAFEPTDKVELRLQCGGAGAAAAQLAAMATGVNVLDMPRISFNHQRVSEEEIADIHRNSHCFVTASRGEAWNLPAFDAMLHGNHVIAPARQGSDHFLYETSAERFVTRLSPASGEIRLIDSAQPGRPNAHYIGAQGLTARQDWLEPDLADLGVLMRRAYAERFERIEVNYSIPERFGRKAVGAQIRHILEGALR